ncbi:MAG: methionine ABC transporter permease [Clostridia bacterium]|nr:methionine ABC transporter permease [Clostridia bacterium]
MSFSLFLNGSLQTLYMVAVSTIFAYVLGLPLGILLAVTGKGGLRPLRIIGTALGFLVNFLRSVPFVILLVALIPFTRFIVGTSLGSTATIVPLVIGSAPFVARMVENSLREVDPGVVEAARSMGATNAQIVFKVMLPECRPSLIVGAAITAVTILGYSTMAGFVGGGGLGAIGINYGYYRYETDVMLVTVLLLVVIVQLIQEAGLRFANRSDKRKNKK